MKKILGFDSWTQGAHNFERLVPALRHHGYELILIHLGSWGHDPGRPREEKIGELTARDISYYENQSFRHILEREQPVAVIFLSVQAFAHRSFNRHCARLGIPTLHLYHGLVNVQAVSGRRAYKINWRGQGKLILSRFAANFFQIVPAYALSLVETKASLRDWGWLGKDIWRKIASQIHNGTAAPDCRTSACCVYAEADVSHAVEHYRLPRESVHPVGNPDLVAFGLTRELAGSRIDAGPGTAEVVYVDTALIEAGVVFGGAREFAEHLRRTAESVGGQGFNLVVKLHPAHARTGVPEMLKEFGIGLVESREFVARLHGAAAAIVEPSSAALIPALLGMPVLLARYGNLADQEYGPVLTSYPRVRLLANPAAIEDVLASEATSVNARGVREWIDRNAGPLPADRMPDRVAEVVRNLDVGTIALARQATSVC